jgi:hypothetical protein
MTFDTILPEKKQMTHSQTPVDCIYLAACARDGRLTRICTASIRYFYPNVPIRILAGDILEKGLAEELQKYWNVGVVDLPAADYGSGFIKLEPLFGPAGQRFMVLDVDTVFAGKVLEHRAQSDAPFIVDDENLPDSGLKRLYYDWDKLRDIDPQVQPARRAFNTGQWFGVAGVLRREDFDPWVEWTLPRRLKYSDRFMTGDQGVQNYVMLQKEAHGGLRMDRRAIMRWPGQSMAGLEIASITACTAPPVVVHWAGMKAMFLRNMAGSDLLQFFERYYYSKLPASRLRRLIGLWRHVSINVSFEISRRIRLRWQIWFGQRAGESSSVLVKQTIGS